MGSFQSNWSQLSSSQQKFAGLSIAGSAISSAGQIASGFEQKSAYDYNAAVALQQSAEQMETTEAKYSTLIGRQASLYAKAGVDIASGSPLLVMAHTAAIGQVEQEREREAGQQQAAMDRWQGRNAMLSGIVGGVGSFLTSFAKTGLSVSQSAGP